MSCTFGGHQAPECRMSAGTFDASWENLGPYLSSMWLEGSTLHGQLPAAWSQAWSHFTALYLSNASLQSSLPPQWGMDGGFPKLGNIHLENNPGLFGELAQHVHTRLDYMLHLWHKVDQCKPRLQHLYQGAALPVLPHELNCLQTAIRSPNTGQIFSSLTQAVSLCAC